MTREQRKKNERKMFKKKTPTLYNLQTHTITRETDKNRIVWSLARTPILMSQQKQANALTTIRLSIFFTLVVVYS